MVSESELKSEDPGFDPLVRHVGDSFTLVQTCLCLLALTFVRTLMIPYPSVVKEQTSQPVVWKHEKTAHRGKPQLGSAAL